MTKQKTREALDAYYREAGSWALDREGALRGSRRTAWIVAGVAVVVALLEAFALLALTPLKTVEPYTLLVDRQTGFVQALKPLNPELVSADKALTQSMLVQYVIARESFDINAVQANYRKVALWSAQGARSDYISSMRASNPQSPLSLYPRSTTVETRVKSVSPVGNGAAMVRFETQRRDAGGQAQPPRAWVTVIRYRFSGEPATQAERFENPLGFEVSHYRRDAEALPPEPEPTPTPAPPPGGIYPGQAPGIVPMPTPAPKAAATPEVEL